MMEKQYVYNAIVRSIYDGDTIRVDIDLGFGVWKSNESLRLAGLDAPEVRGIERPFGLLSRDWLVAQIPPGTSLLIQTEKDRKEKYGRYIATIWLPDGTNLNEKMIAEQKADVYGKPNAMAAT